MQKQAPSLGRIVVMVGFALSCFGLLLFLWLAFGGPVPLKPKGYRFTVPFREAGQLAQEADVRISGVTVGKVKAVDA
ncbi:MAG TPA: MlaD family protein, partial [Baekduia sp.]|nr:MlaD family protein [Baekduia sp.]